MNLHGGGAQTNINGLKFEQDTNITQALAENGYSVDDKYRIYDDEGNEVGMDIGKNRLYKNLLEPNNVDCRALFSKKLLPDEAVYVYKKNTVYIIEKKFQKTNGTVDEKLQTCDFKNRQYKKLFSKIGIEVKYIYLLNDWFLRAEYDDVKEYILDVGCYYFFNKIPINFLF